MLKSSSLPSQRQRPAYVWYRPHRDLALYPDIVKRVARVHRLTASQRSCLLAEVIEAINAGDLQMCSPVTTIPQHGKVSVTGAPLIATSYTLFNDWLALTNRHYLQVKTRPYRGPLRAGVVKQSILIARHKPQWKTITSDIKSAHMNGLSRARRRGGWSEVEAVRWAEKQRKYSKPLPPPKYTSRIHRIR